MLEPGAPFHIHFSDIQYANRNETKHLPYGEGTLRAEPLREALARFERPATVITESPDEASTQAIRAILVCVSAEEVERALRGGRDSGRGSPARTSCTSAARRRRSSWPTLGRAPGGRARALDVGAGLGGPARFLAERFAVDVTGVDVTAAFVERAEALTRDAGLAGRVRFVRADATALPFADGAFDVGWTQHAAMNDPRQGGTSTPS